MNSPFGNAAFDLRDSTRARHPLPAFDRFSLYLRVGTDASAAMTDDDGNAVLRLTRSDTGVAAELRTDWNAQPLMLSVSSDALKSDGSHDVLVRYGPATFELYVDGVLVDEEWYLGELVPTPTRLSVENSEQCAFWTYALSDDDIATLGGGVERVAARRRVLLPDAGEHMAYWRPPGFNTSAGDCMPFYHDGRFHLFYLFDRRHHRSKWGLGAHQWTHASTEDLVHWEHHPLAIPITEPWESSICTGSVIAHEGVYHAFYATRMPDGSQHLGHAISRDGIRFDKTTPNPFASPQPGYDPMHYRDPEAFRDASGRFHLLVTARLTDGRDGCLAHLVSDDLYEWFLEEPFLIPGRVTDCPHLFEWNGWYYLFAEFVYWMSRSPAGPWVEPTPNRLDLLYVPKTAPFGGNRRIYVTWLPDRGWGGDLVFRELVQREDGTLGTRFVPELEPPTGDPVPLRYEPLTSGVERSADGFRIQATSGFGAAALDGLPSDFRLRMRVVPSSGAGSCGFCVRGDGAYESGCEVRFEPGDRRVQFGTPNGGQPGERTDAAISHVSNLDAPFDLDIVAKGDILDVCMDRQRTMVTRHGVVGSRLFLFASDADVAFESVDVRPLAMGT